ncbi:MAG: hypothetical protein AB1640_00760 [bacterium]
MKTKELARGDRDRAMEEIEELYGRMFLNGKGAGKCVFSIKPEVKSRLHKRILSEIEHLRETQRVKQFGSWDYREIDCRIRRRLLKEIQIIIDAYVVAREEERLEEWEAMYGDIEHYKRDFFYFRMDPDYEVLRKVLSDYRLVED